jgi:hypothetical protein
MSYIFFNARQPATKPVYDCSKNLGLKTLPDVEFQKPGSENLLRNDFVSKCNLDLQ